MRKLWLAGVAVVPLLSAGCAVGPTSSPTTTSHASVTTVKGKDTSKGNNRAACAQYVTIHNLGKTVTAAQYRLLIKDLRHAQDPALRSAGRKVAKGLTTGNTSKVDAAMLTASQTCTTLGLG